MKKNRRCKENFQGALKEQPEDGSDFASAVIQFWTQKKDVSDANAEPGRIFSVIPK